MPTQNIDPIFTCTWLFFQLGAVHVYLGALRAWFSQRAIWTPGPLCESNMKHTFEHLQKMNEQYRNILSFKRHTQVYIYTVNSEMTPTTKSLVSILGLLGGFSALMQQPTTPTNIPGVSKHCSPTSQVGWQIMICKYNPESFSLLRTFPLSAYLLLPSCLPSFISLPLMALYLLLVCPQSDSQPSNVTLLPPNYQTNYSLSFSRFLTSCSSSLFPMAVYIKVIISAMPL